MDEQTIREKFSALAPYLNERSKRLWVATEAKSIGRCGVRMVSTATGMFRTTIYQGIKDLA